MDLLPKLAVEEEAISFLVTLDDKSARRLDKIVQLRDNCMIARI